MGIIGIRKMVGLWIGIVRIGPVPIPVCLKCYPQCETRWVKEKWECGVKKQRTDFPAAV